MSKKKDNQQELQELYMQLQYINTQLEQLQKEAEAVDQKRQEFLMLSERLGEMDKVKVGAKSFSDIGVGIFAQTKIADKKELLVNVGANTFVKKSVKSVKKTLDKQVAEFEQILEQLSQNMNVLAIQSQLIQMQMQKSLGAE